MVGILKGLLSTVTHKSLSSPGLWKEYAYFHLATFESYSLYLDLPWQGDATHSEEH